MTDGRTKQEVFSFGNVLNTVIAGAVIWMATTVQSLSNSVISIRTELDLVKPADVKAEVQEVSHEVRQLRLEIAAFKSDRQ